MYHFLIHPTFTELTQGFDFGKQIMQHSTQKPGSAIVDEVFLREDGYDNVTTAMYAPKEEFIYPLDYFESNPTQSQNYLTPMQRVERPGARAEKFLISIGALTLGLVVLDGYLGGTIFGF